MEIRPVRPDEHDELGRITVAAYRHLLGDEPLGPYEDELRDVAFRASDSVVLVALEAAGALLGGVTYVPDAHRKLSEFSDPEAAGIRMLAVDPARQGRGAGRALSEACIARARSEGRARIVLHSTPVMVVAHGMYERLGFARTPEHDEWVVEPPYDARPVHLMGFVLELGRG